MKRSVFLPLLLVVALILASCTVVLPLAEEALATPGDENGTDVTENAALGPEELIALAMANEQLKSLGTAIVQQGLLDILLSDGPYTILAPTDEAFAELDDDTVQALLDDDEQLGDFLRSHIISGTVTLDDLRTMESVEAISGAVHEVVVEDDVLYVGQALVLVGDISLPNGTLHVISEVLAPAIEEEVVTEPPDEIDNGLEAELVNLAMEYGNLLLVTEILISTGFLEQLEELDSYTLFAPTDDAFEALDEEILAALADDPDALSNVLEYHIVPAALPAEDLAVMTETMTLAGLPLEIETDPLQVAGALVIEADVPFGDGILHVVNAVLLPPAEEAVPVDEDEIDLKDEVDEAVLDAVRQISFVATVRMLAESGLLEDLEEIGPITIFAPNDQAFGRLTRDQLVELATDSEKQRDLVEAHIVPGNILAEDLMPGELVNVAGQEIEISIDPVTRATLIDGAKVIWVNMRAGDAVVHIIDGVLFAEAITPAPDEIEVEPEEIEAEPEEVEVEPEEVEIEPEDPDIVEEDPEAVHAALAAEPRLETLRALLELADLSRLPRDAAPVTILAPSDAAFAELPDALVLSIIRADNALAELLSYHVIPGRLTAEELVELGEVVTLADRAVDVSLDEDVLMFDGVAVVDTIEASDGVIYLLDSVLMPPGLPLDVVGRIYATDELSEFARLLDLSGFDKTLSQLGPITVLAPTNAAFESLTETQMEALTADTDVLAAWLQRHVIPRRVTFRDLQQFRSIDTLGREVLTVRISRPNLLVGGMRIAEANIRATNGLIHTVDTVVLPGN